MGILEKPNQTSGIDPKSVQKDKQRFTGLQIHNKELLESLSGDEKKSHRVMLVKFEEWLYELSNCKHALDRRTFLCTKYSTICSKKRKLSDEEYVLADKRSEKMKQKIEAMNVSLEDELKITVGNLEQRLNVLLVRFYGESMDLSKKKSDYKV